MANKELLPCPFCGGEAEFGVVPRGHDIMSMYVVCAKCSARGEPFKYDYWQHKRKLEQREKAIKAWNTRTSKIPVGNGENYEVTHNDR